MTNHVNCTPRGGIDFMGALLLLFIGLKLGGAIDWSWWWVLSPFWIPLSIVMSLVLLLVVLKLLENRRG